MAVRTARPCALRWTARQSTALHDTALLCCAVHFTAQHGIARRCAALRCTALHSLCRAAAIAGARASAACFAACASACGRVCGCVLHGKVGSGACDSARGCRCAGNLAKAAMVRPPCPCFPYPAFPHTLRPIPAKSFLPHALALSLARVPRAHTRTRARTLADAIARPVAVPHYAHSSLLRFRYDHAVIPL